MDSKNRNNILCLVFLILGVTISAQFRSLLNINSTKPRITDEINSLKNDIKLEKEKNIKISNAIDEIEKKKVELLNFDVITSKNKDLEQLIQEKNVLSLPNGLVDVKGPGVTIEIMDAPSNGKRLSSLQIVHDFDIVRILNELKKAGAQAISVNDERVISTSEIMCAGPTVKINNNRYPAPFIINAIGDQKKLYDSLMNSDIVGLLSFYKIKVKVEKSKNVFIPKYYNKISDLTTALEEMQNEN